jgi:hypothetical protein
METSIRVSERRCRARVGAVTSRWRGAFSLLELLVSCGVIAVVLALALPAMGRARESGRSTVCKSSLRQLGQCGASFSQTFRDALPNIALRSEYVIAPDMYNFEIDDMTHGMSYYAQVMWWHAALIGFAFDGGTTTGGVPPCPNVPRLMGPHFRGTHYLSFSYYYPTTNISHAGLWSPEFPARRLESDQWRRTVLASEVRFPSRKVLYAEQATYHERHPGVVWRSTSGAINIVTADGAAMGCDVQTLVEPMAYDRLSAIQTWIGDAERVPLCGSAEGVAGIDFLPR